MKKEIRVRLALGLVPVGIAAVFADHWLGAAIVAVGLAWLAVEYFFWPANKDVKKSDSPGISVKMGNENRVDHIGHQINERREERGKGR